MVASVLYSIAFASRSKNNWCHQGPDVGSASPGRVETCCPLTQKCRPGHFANRDGTPGQTFKLGQSRPNRGRMVGPTLTKIQNLNLTSGSSVKGHLLILLFTKSAAPQKSDAPGHCRPPFLDVTKTQISNEFVFLDFYVAALCNLGFAAHILCRFGQPCTSAIEVAK